MECVATPEQSILTVPVNDPRRLSLKRTVFATLLAAAMFFICTVPTKQYKPLYIHAPWENDPFDTVYSFAMFIVPLLAACFLVQVSLCRKREPLSIYRAWAILRACRVTVAVMAIALLTDWAAVTLAANRSQWNAGGTGLLLALLSATTLVTAKATLDLARAPKFSTPGSSRDRPGSDWLTDAVTVARRESRWLGPLRPTTVRFLGWVEDQVVAQVRRHPLSAAAMTAGVFGAGVGANQSIREGYSLPAAAFVIILLFCGMFSFLVVAGAYLGIVRSETHLNGARRRAVDAVVVGCAAAVAALAFRDVLWAALGVNPSTVGAGNFALLVTCSAAAVMAVVFVVETSLRLHKSISRRSMAS
jgi:hypothetical protein